jgi:hypothetical protein
MEQLLLKQEIKRQMCDWGGGPNEIYNYYPREEKAAVHCPWCDWGYDDPDDCLCDDPCGSIACQGILMKGSKDGKTNSKNK